MPKDAAKLPSDTPSNCLPDPSKCSLVPSHSAVLHDGGPKVLATRLDLHGGGGVARPAGVLDPPPPWFTTGAGRAKPVVDVFLPKTSFQKRFPGGPGGPHRRSPPTAHGGTWRRMDAHGRPKTPHFVREGCQNPPPERSKIFEDEARPHKTTQDDLRTVH